MSKEGVLQYCDWSEQEYLQMVFERGIDYIECEYESQDIIEAMKFTKPFWGWWKTTQKERDAFFIRLVSQSPQEVIDKSFCRELFYLVNQAHNIELYPSGALVATALSTWKQKNNRNQLIEI